jgi:hypothetical protein
MSMVSEFSDFFLEEMSIVPPDRDIKFVIKLVSATAPMYKTPYRMVAKQIAELKDRIKELLEGLHQP